VLTRRPGSGLCAVKCSKVEGQKTNNHPVHAHDSDIMFLRLMEFRLIEFRLFPTAWLSNVCCQCIEQSITEKGVTQGAYQQVKQCKCVAIVVRCRASSFSRCELCMSMTIDGFFFNFSSCQFGCQHCKTRAAAPAAASVQAPAERKQEEAKRKAAEEEKRKQDHQENTWV